MNAVFDCFKNRREVPEQELSADFVLLQELADEARTGDVADRAAARIVILDTLRGMWREDMGHRERVEAARVAGLLWSLGMDEEVTL